MAFELQNIMATGKKILIVDDEEDICYFLSSALKKRNFDTTVVHTLADAERIIKRDRPSILLLDNHLPDGYGINSISKIKSAYPDVKIIMITAHDSSQDKMKALNNGANYFLSKPFSLSEVNKAIDQLASNN